MKDYIITIVILAITAITMIIIGFIQYRKKDKPVNFWSGESSPNDVVDIAGYNKTHGKMWAGYGIAIFISGIVGMFFNSPIIASAILFLTVAGGIPVLFYIHYKVCAKYRKK